MLLPLDHLVLASGDGAKVKDGPVHTLQYQRAVFHSPGNKDKATSGDNMFFIFQPELDFSSQIIGIPRVASKKADHFVKIVGMSLT